MVITLFDEEAAALKVAFAQLNTKLLKLRGSKVNVGEALVLGEPSFIAFFLAN